RSVRKVRALTEPRRQRLRGEGLSQRPRNKRPFSRPCGAVSHQVELACAGDDARLVGEAHALRPDLASYHGTVVRLCYGVSPPARSQRQARPCTTRTPPAPRGRVDGNLGRTG